ncbi:MAG TPA: CpaF family protein, partial [Sphingomicrobium sp.]
MSAFGRRSGMGAGAAGRPAFGVARPMQGPGGAQPAADTAEQFPPLPNADDIDADQAQGNMPGSNAEAMARLTERQNASGEAAGLKAEGFEASVHKIKEQ